MSSRDGRSGPAHMAPKERKSPSESRSVSGNTSAARSASVRRSASGTGRSSSGRGTSLERERERQRREQLRDRYYYEENEDGLTEEEDRFQDVSSYSSPEKRGADLKELERQKGKKKKMGKGKKAVIIVSVVLVLLIAFAAWYIFGYMLGGLTVDTDFTRDPVALGVFPANSNPDDEPIVLDDSIKNIALFGVDSRGSSFNGLSDVVMILTVDNRHKKIKMTSILRDSCVVLEGGSYMKLTEVYAYGGPELAVKVLNTNFSIGNHPLNIREYVTVNFAKMAQIVDACGGVDLDLTAAEVQQININMFHLLVDVQESIEDDMWTGDYKNRDDYAMILNEDFIPNIYGYRDVGSADYEYEGGRYHLNGNQAVAYGRIRYIDSDDVRASRQQNVLKAMIEKVRSKGKLEYPDMIRQIVPMCKTSLDVGDVMGMLPIIFTDFTIETLNVPSHDFEAPYDGELSNGGEVYVYDLDYAAMHINAFIYENDSPYYGEDIYPGIGYIPDVPESGTANSGAAGITTPGNGTSSSPSSSPEGDEPGRGEEGSSSSSEGEESSGSSSEGEESSSSSEGGSSEEPGSESSEDPGGGESSGDSGSGEEDGGNGDMPPEGVVF